jgi:LuxR family maltose regulon positive regulatory protein
MLVSAPPGAGKTTLLVSWLQGHGNGNVAWLGLEPSHNGRDRFVVAVTDALADAVDARATGRADDDDPRAALANLLHVLERSRGPVTTLVLDDVHELTDASALGHLGYLVDHAPAGLRIVLATRADPPLRMGRLRLANRIGELRNAELAFTVDETASLFAALGLRLRQAEVRSLHDLTEGWVAGLRLLAFAMARGADPKRFLDDRGLAESVVADYLLREVLEQQRDEVRRFMMRTSVVDNLTHELANELTDDPQAGAELDEVESLGVFLSTADGGQTYRYHALFAALLRAQLRHHEPELHRELQTRAARWYAAHDDHEEAELHARRAENWSMVGALALSRWVGGILAGEETVDTRVVEAPHDAVASTPALALVAAGAACAVGDWDAYERARGWARTSTDGETETSGDIETEAQLLLSATAGRSFGVEAAATAAAAELAASPRGELRRHGGQRAPEHRQDEGDREGADLDHPTQAEEAPASWTGDVAVRLLGLSNAIEGRISTALALSGGVPWVDGRFSTPLAAEATRLTRALVLAQRGHRSSAIEELRAEGSATSSRAVRAVAAALQAALHAGRFASAPVGAMRQPLADRTLVALGVLEVLDAGGSLHLPGGPAEAQLRRARSSLASGAFGPAVTEAMAIDPSDRTCHPRTAIEGLTVAAIAESAMAHHAEANRLLSEAVEVALVDEMWAPLLAHGPSIFGLVERVAAGVGSSASSAVRLLDQLRPLQLPAYVQALTPQEESVLQFLPTLMSNAEIADAMHLSVNTVKTHLKSLYRKLGAERRRDAVVSARQLELLA